MMALYTSLFLWTFALLFPTTTGSISCQPFRIKPEHLNKQLVGYKMFEMQVTSHHKCANECMLLGACVSINFVPRTKSCEINSARSDEALTTDFKKVDGIIFSDISEWPQNMVRGCAHHRCNNTQRCFPLSSDTYKCLDITCRDKSKRKFVEPSSVIAGTVRPYVYVCPDDMFLSGDKKITCSLNGEWSASKAACQEPTIGTACSGNSDCKEDGAVCKRGKCYCSHLYRYDVKAKDCIKVCSAMTKTFNKEKNTAIFNRNDLGRTTVASEVDCYKLCAEDKNCLSLEFAKNSLECRRSSYTKQMVLDVIPLDVVKTEYDTIFYERICL